MLPENAIQRARSLRRMATPAEQQLWRALKEAFPLVRFRRQVPIGPYIVDFLSHAHRLIVEVDGGQHAIQQGYDAARTHFLEDEGYCVLRFWNMDVADHLDGVISEIGANLVVDTAPHLDGQYIEGRAQ
ncbi:endonuclease domain-containing protein [Pseudonocardia sp. TMWB2A]